MPTPNQPQLGYGKQTEASLDQANQWMRQQPWYQDYMRSIGQDPGHPTLTDEQRQQVVKLAQANGVVVNEGAQEIDNHGNFRDKGMGLGKKILIGAAIGGAALTGLGAAGIGPMSGLFSAGAGAGGGGFGVGGLSAASTGLPVTAGLGTAGSVGTGASGLAGVGSLLKKVGPGLLAAGKGIGAATSAAGQNRLTQEELDLQANAQNISGESAYQNELIRRAELEAAQRETALKDTARHDYFSSRKPGPFESGAPSHSADYMSTLKDLGSQGRETLAKPSEDLPPLTPYKPYVPSQQPGSKPGGLEKVGNLLSPTLSTIGAFAGGNKSTQNKPLSYADYLAMFGG